MKERETFASRLGFVLISAGCAIGLGNVWRFPYIVGQYGGAAFVLIYLLFLVIMGLPIMAMEFSVGRASRKSILASFQVLEPKGSKWHWYGWFGMAGNYLLMMFYTTIAGWLLLYFFKVAAGEFRGLDAAGVENAFGAMQGNVGIQLLFMQVHLTKIISVTYTPCLQHCLRKFYIPTMLVFSQFAYLIGKNQGFITVFICISRDMRNCFIFVRMCFVIR